ncbi:hypothetical protein DL766_008596 [Monosporascus sp. MC13-8B]|uniref:Uncharacterized protein n=1 Tax=Monosporascus cannonballus TaxID=155416 RepID=A0ABY0H7Y1_9PEZI|nr:hypothetical protein DL763_007272 [Monosporascus cannonballus]RYO87155.1 hypothetical protein DL762_004359 [Monosporascus cannonballus]RYP18774.1 hypothetical protein DL766_008596 [Monosporascus sp. MC13-8B]
MVAPLLVGKPFTKKAEDLPERAAGSTQLSFAAVTPDRASDADVNIWIELQSALEVVPEFQWKRTESSSIVTTVEEIPKALWKKAVARWSNTSLLLEDREVRKEVPEALREKAKGKGKRVKVSFQGSIADDPDSAVESDCVIGD